jgi:hypothetical protein
MDREDRTDYTVKNSILNLSNYKCFEVALLKVGCPLRTVLLD